MPAPTVVAFLNSGRCGTQWLAHGLRALYDGLDVEHEPIGPLYKPRRYFRRYDDPEAILEVPEVARHIAWIEQTSRRYVETGWPLFPALPLLAARLGSRLRIVHLTRHPVPSALSHLAHKSYADSPRDDAYTRLATLGPKDPNVFGSSYADCWEWLTPYERCLFWWTEVHMYAIELAGRVDGVQMLRLKSEDLLSGNRAALQELLAFMGLPWRDGWSIHARHVIDRWHHHTDEYVDPLEIHRHPSTVAIGEELGYDMAGLNLGALEERYHGEPDPGLDRVGRFA